MATSSGHRVPSTTLVKRCVDAVSSFCPGSSKTLLSNVITSFTYGFISSEHGFSSIYPKYRLQASPRNNLLKAVVIRREEKNVLQQLHPVSNHKA